MKGAVVIPIFICLQGFCYRLCFGSESDWIDIESSPVAMMPGDERSEMVSIDIETRLDTNFWAAVWLCVIVAWPVGLVGAETTPSAPRRHGKVVFVSPPGQHDDMTAIVENTRAEVYNLPVAVVAEQVAFLPASADAQRALAETVMMETDSDVVFWCVTRDTMSVRFLFRTDSGADLMERGLEGSGKEGVADAVGLIAGGAVRFLYRQGAFDPPRMRPQGEQTLVAERAAEKKAQPSAAERPRYRRLRFLSRLAYITQMATREPGFTHGGRVSLSISIERMLRFSLGLELFTPVVSESGGVGFERFRVPFHIGVALMAPVGNWHVGGEVTAVFSSARHRPYTHDDAFVMNEENYRFLVTMEVLAQAEYQFSSYFGLFGGLGLELFFEKVTYGIDAEGPVVFEEYQVVQPKLMIGVWACFG